MPTMSAPSTAGTNPSMWNGTVSLCATQLVSQNSRPLTTMAISPKVAAYARQPTTLTIGLRTALMMPKMSATATIVPTLPAVECVCTWMPEISTVAAQTAAAVTTSLISIFIAPSCQVTGQVVTSRQMRSSRRAQAHEVLPAGLADSQMAASSTRNRGYLVSGH